MINNVTKAVRLVLDQTMIIVRLAQLVILYLVIDIVVKMVFIYKAHNAKNV